MIRVEELTKDYGSRRALHGLTFEARQGEVVGFLGPNGAGKTTTMRILTSYMPPTSGEAVVAGYNVVSESLEVRKRVGYLPETVPLYTDMVVFDYLKFMADLRHLPDAEERVGETLEMVGLLDRANGYIGNLSKGMRQRIGLAQALLHRPEVLILDEPTIGLDVNMQQAVRRFVAELFGIAARRLRRANTLGGAGSELLRDYDGFEQDFLEFFPGTTLFGILGGVAMLIGVVLMYSYYGKTYGNITMGISSIAIQLP